jgi:hypothetical protein
VIPRKITILWSEQDNFTVIIDGLLSDHLTWDEMLGQVASATLTGKSRYRGLTIGERSDWWNQPKGLLKGNV